jgi:hypothetical protein
MHGRGDKCSLFIIFVRKLKGKHIFENEWNWEDNIKIYLKKTKCGRTEYNHLLCSREQSREDKGSKIFISWGHVSFSRNCSMRVPDLLYNNQPNMKHMLEIGNQMQVHFLFLHDNWTQGHPDCYAAGDARGTKAVRDHTWRIWNRMFSSYDSNYQRRNVATEVLHNSWLPGRNLKLNSIAVLAVWATTACLQKDLSGILNTTWRNVESAYLVFLCISYYSQSTCDYFLEVP